MPLPLEIDEENRRMFGWIDETWNPVTGCKHGCYYCWARDYATGWLKHKDRYKHGFTHHSLNKNEFNKKFTGKTVFVSSMGDLFGDWVKDAWIKKVLNKIKENPTHEFLLLTKNPKRYRRFLKMFPKNVLLGATIETNRNYITSKSKNHKPQTRFRRYVSMKTLDSNRKVVAIEPIMDFDLLVFEKWIREIKPENVSISFDNHNKGVKSPDVECTIDFCERLSQFTLVHIHGDWIKEEKIRKKLGKMRRKLNKKTNK